MSNLFLKTIIACLCIFLVNNTLLAQVNAIGTGVSGLDMTNSQTSFTTNNIAVPSANGRLLVITILVRNTANITSVEFTETGQASLPATLANSGSNNLNLAIYYVALTGSNAVNGTVTVNSDSNTDFGVFVRAFEQVDLGNPIDVASNNFLVHTTGTDAIVTSEVNDMIVDIRFSSTAIDPLGAGQLDVAPALSSNQIRSSYKTASAGTTTMSNAQPSEHLITALNFGPPILNVSENGLISNGGTVNFGNVEEVVGTNSKTFTLQNTGNSDLLLTAGMPLIQIGGTDAADFVVTSGPMSTIAPNASTTFTITFDPSMLGARVATVTIPTNAGTFSFQLNGNGIETPIPTMSQWGLLIFGLLLLNLGVFFVREKEMVS